MKQEKLWKKELILIIIIGILVLWIFLVIKLNWVKDTAKEKWNEIKESTLIEWASNQNWKDWTTETSEWDFSYSVFHEWKKEKEEDYSYNLENYSNNYENYDYNIDDDYNYDEYNETY